MIDLGQNVTKLQEQVKSLRETNDHLVDEMEELRTSNNIMKAIRTTFETIDDQGWELKKRKK